MSYYTRIKEKLLRDTQWEYDDYKKMMNQRINELEFAYSQVSFALIPDAFLFTYTYIF
jgi:hypothetical protein